jgi:hypothetical protein
VNQNLNITTLVRKTKEIMEQREIQSTLADIYGQHHHKKMNSAYNLEYWFGKDINKEKHLSQQLVLTAYALELVGIKLISSKVSNSKDVLEHAAKMFEYAGSYLDISKSYQLDILRHAAVCYDAGGFPSNSIVMARKVLQELDTTSKPMETIPRFYFYLNFLIYSFLARKFSRVEKYSQTVMAERLNVQEVINSIDDEQKKNAEIVRLIGSLEISNAIYNFYQFLINGREIHHKESFEGIERAVQIFLDSDDSQNFALSTLLSAIMKEIEKGFLVVLTLIINGGLF